MRTGAKAVLCLVLAGMAALAVFGVTNIYQALAGGNDGDDVQTGPPSAAEVRTTARDFLAAWADRRPAAAARLTDYAAEAQPVLGAYFTDARVREVALEPGAAKGATVPFSVSARVVAEGHAKTWTYDSELTVVRGRTTGEPLVDWESSVVHPDLAENHRLVTREGETPQVVAVGADGRTLSEEEYPSLGPVFAQLRERYAGKLRGEPGIEVLIEQTDGAQRVRSLLRVSKGRPAKLPTTLDAGVQRAAEEAVRDHHRASVVAVRPSTGEILAVANAKGGGEFNNALQGATAPGSTFKIITSAALLAGGVTPETPVSCPRTYAHDQGMTFRNAEGAANEDATFAQDFAQSCNTAFVSLSDELADDELAATARRWFGLGDDDWQSGVATFDGGVPVGDGDEKSAAIIGQGRVQMNPLTMASVAATVRSGAFRQPVLLPRSFNDRDLATAEPLPAGVAADLRGMMELTAADGTAAGVGLGAGAGAKTGSAEVGGQERPDSWFTAYRGDVAAAAVVPAGGHGSDAAGPVVKEVLAAG
ncbi:penicillin-binding transpeptidase domain-containing protein [Streptomyces sp. WMMC500]|uniref:penicillin-binding transpeptidase domain-containing protein n=1 Tax=Streptomyces sp. WMMC500 TaxID=3015154 RepID=UPI00248BAEC4|nr:penicillin-binding transpeptidase domain-containing protein [Streptomyces sp. WMMC500]WBB62244.1 penicillin-binding transpeptidase domain-containing protein [Streptomyces sp. WMMC500]